MAGTTNRSMAAVCGRWLRRKVLRRCSDGWPSVLAMYLATVDCASKAELEQLAMNARCTPKRILDAHSTDQRP